MHITYIQLFQTTKIQIFESNSQHFLRTPLRDIGCFRLQRYKFLKAIHNLPFVIDFYQKVVSDYKDTNFWKQFTTYKRRRSIETGCFRLQRYKFLKAIHNGHAGDRQGDELFQTTKIQIFESNSQLMVGVSLVFVVVSDYKDTNFWKQFTTHSKSGIRCSRLFQTTKIQIFESNSQLDLNGNCLIQVVSDYKDTNFWKQFTTTLDRYVVSCVVSDYKDTNFWKQFTTHPRASRPFHSCFRLQRYKLLKAIHNLSPSEPSRSQLFQTTKIQIFESNSQLIAERAISFTVVSDYKDTNFWKQFTTVTEVERISIELFQTTKIQIFESNSQLIFWTAQGARRCFRLQRYKLLKAIHNTANIEVGRRGVVSDYKDTNFWKQFTTELLQVAI